MKHTIVAIAFAAMIFAANAQHTWDTVCASNSVTIAATAGTNVAKVIDCRKQGSAIPFQIELMADATGAYTFSIPFQYSLDGVTFANMASSTVSISFNGVTKQTVVTNIPTQGALWLRVPYLTNATAGINAQ